VTRFAPRAELLAWLDAGDYVGDAPERAAAFAELLRRSLGDAAA
jgi:hypothetical protein